MRYRLFVFLLCFIAHYVGGYAQQYNRHLEAARVHADNKNHKKASQAYWKAVLLQPDNPMVISSAASYYTAQNEFDMLAATYEKGQNYSGKNADYSLQLAQSYLLNNELSKAKAVLNRKQGVYDRNHALYPVYAKLQRDIDFQLRLTPSADSISVVNLGNTINTKFDEYYPSIHGNDEELQFTRKTNGVDEDFYVAYRDSLCEWTKVVDKGIPFNTSKDEGAHFISMDRNYMFYMRCGNQRTNTATMGGCDLYMAYRQGDGWTEAEPFGATINTAYYEGMPCLSGDNKKLYFASDKPGGYGGMDIWVTTFENGLWQIPQNLGPEVNTPFDEIAPFLAIDGKTFYFSSNGHPGFGGFDVFTTYKKSDSSWAPVVNMGSTINTRSNEVSFVVHAGGTKAYFASDRNGGFGGYDLYETLIPTTLQPQPMTIVYGRITDTFSVDLLPNAVVEFFDMHSNALITQVYANKGDASYVVPLPIQKPIVRKIFRFGYQEKIDTLVLARQSLTVFELGDVALLPEGYEEPTITLELTKVNFEKNQLEVAPEILANLAAQIKTYADTGFTIQVYGYTDDTGTPFINQELSYRRAQLIADAIVAAGISIDKVDVRGWGNAQPLHDNDSEINRYLNRRVEITIIGTERLFNELEMWE